MRTKCLFYYFTATNQNLFPCGPLRRFSPTIKARATELLIEFFKCCSSDKKSGNVLRLSFASDNRFNLPIAFMGTEAPIGHSVHSQAEDNKADDKQDWRSNQNCKSPKNRSFDFHVASTFLLNPFNKR